jgi:hypothetical protein
MPTSRTDITGVYITGVHPYTFRCGTPALITGVKKLGWEIETPRVCYEVTFPDGVVDYIPLCDMNNYKIVED